MKLFTKVTLVSAIAVSGNAMAMQAMDDQSLSAATGQDGITIKIAPQTTDTGWRTWVGGLSNAANIKGGMHISKVYVHDTDGLTGSLGTPGQAASGTTPAVAPVGTGVATATAGAISIDGVDLAAQGPIVVKIDSDGNGNTSKSAVLNVNVALDDTTIKLGEIGVIKSNRDAVAKTWGVDTAAGSYNKILNPLSVRMGPTTMNIQLGAQPQGAMIKIAGTMTGGLSISGLELFDTDGVAGFSSTDADPTKAALGTPGSIYVGNLSVSDAGAADLTVRANVDVSAAGLVLTTGGTTNMDVRISDVRLGNVAAAGSNKSIGDVELLGINSIGTKLIISGH